jgi:hypothetical protein
MLYYVRICLLIRTDGHDESVRTQDGRKKEDVDRNHVLESIRGAKLTSFFCVVLRVRMHGAVLPLRRRNGFVLV